VHPAARVARSDDSTARWCPARLRVVLRADGAAVRVARWGAQAGPSAGSGEPGRSPCSSFVDLARPGDELTARGRQRPAVLCVEEAGGDVVICLFRLLLFLLGVLPPYNTNYCETNKMD